MRWPWSRWKRLGHYLRQVGVTEGQLQAAIRLQEAARGKVNAEAVRETIVHDLRIQQDAIAEQARQVTASTTRAVESIRRELIDREPVTGVREMPEEIRQMLRDRDERESIIVKLDE